MKRHSHIEGHHVERSAGQVQQDDAKASANFLQDCPGDTRFFLTVLLPLI